MIFKPGKDRTLSPREFALSIGVSESSVKRWIDAGRVPARITTGGHRRIDLVSALRFIRESRSQLIQPELLGFPDLCEGELGDHAALAARIYEHLHAGRGQELSDLVIGALVTRSIQPAELFDGPIRIAMQRIGELWTGGEEGIFIEHRASQLLLGLLDQLDGLYTPPSEDLIAVGGSIGGDPSSLPTRMAATILATEGIYPVNLGSNTPAMAFLDAAEQTGAQLVWISVSYVEDLERQSAELDELIDELARRGLYCILGGREVHRLQLELDGRAQIGDSMYELAKLGRQLFTGHRS